MHEIEEPTRDEYGADVHPAFGLLGASRVSHSPPGVVLFDSDIQHQYSVIVRLGRASRKRDINRDWIHGDISPMFEVEMSEAQWASFVSSMNVGDGVPVTIRHTSDEYNVPGLPYDPRLKHSMTEVRDAAHHVFDEIKDAMAEYQKALDDRVGAKERNRALDMLQAKIRNAVPNLNYAAKSLGEHAENVVQRARADIEAMVVNKARQLGIEPGDIRHTLEIGGDAEQ